MNTQKLRSLCENQEVFPSEVLTWISEQNYWNLWVPKSLGGMEKSLSVGLKILQNLAFIDGSLGWTVTLCAGANYFAGNLKPEFAKEIFTQTKKPVLGGSGGAFGTAEKVGEKYLLNGTWKYATGAPYLTHFTLNAKITEKGFPLKNEKGEIIIRSFVLPAKQVEIIPDWNTMGLKSTATHSFKVNKVMVSESNSFVYNHFYRPQDIFKIPFSVFADLTLWVNYLGMAQHYYKEAEKSLLSDRSKVMLSDIKQNENELFAFSEQVELRLKKNLLITSEFEEALHQTASGLIQKLSKNIIEIHPLLGMKAAREDHVLNHIFKDYFTATQHKNFAGR